MKKTVSLALCALLLAGCSGNNARNILGLDRRSPDAYAVTTTAPLEMPDSVAALPPPVPGKPRPQDVTPQQRAQQAAGVRSAYTGSAPSAAEQALLNRAGPADPNVRVAVNRQAAKDADKQTGPLDWMLFWRDRPEPGVVLNPKAEAERLKAAKASGQAPTATPTRSIDETERLGVAKEIQ